MNKTSNSPIRINYTKDCIIDYWAKRNIVFFSTLIVLEKLLENIDFREICE